MPFIEWEQSFSVGQPVLDADHKQLVHILNRIYDAWQEHNPDKANLNRLFDELMDYTDGHFLREEGKLAARGYDKLDTHHGAHERLRELVMSFRTRHLSGAAPDQLTEDMAKFLRSWLVDHILGDDMEYKPLFTGG